MAGADPGPPGEGRRRRGRARGHGGARGPRPAPRLARRRRRAARRGRHHQPPQEQHAVVRAPAPGRAVLRLQELRQEVHAEEQPAAPHAPRVRQGAAVPLPLLPAPQQAQRPAHAARVQPAQGAAVRRPGRDAHPPVIRASITHNPLPFFFFLLRIIYFVCGALIYNFCVCTNNSVFFVCVEVVIVLWCDGLNFIMIPLDMHSYQRF